MRQREQREPGAGDDAPVGAPSFDEREAATAQPVVPLDRLTTSAANGHRPRARLSVSAAPRYLLLAWAIAATAAAGAVALYRNVPTGEPLPATQPSPGTTTGEIPINLQPTRRATSAPITQPAKVSGAPVTRVPQGEVGRPGQGEGKWNDLDEEERAERAREEGKRRLKDEEKRREEAEERREEAEEEAEERAERARKEARKRKERLRDRRKARLIDTITKKSAA